MLYHRHGDLDSRLTYARATSSHDVYLATEVRNILVGIEGVLSEHGSGLCFSTIFDGVPSV